MSFQNRWTIVGELTSTTPLHIGSGNTLEHPQLVNSQTGRSVQINSVCTDKDGRPYIPGSTLKGTLRAWAKRAGLNTANFEQLFGSEDPENRNSVGGKVEFFDAVAAIPPDFPEGREPPYWRAERRTGVKAGVMIDRRTGTASEERLFHHEFVPPGVRFSIMIGGQNLSDSELEELLVVLGGFDQEEVVLGAGSEDGWGRMAWTLTDLRRLAKEEVMSWIDGGASKVGYAALAPLPDVELQQWINRVQERIGLVGTSSALRLEMTLAFESHFLVNDPSRTGTNEESKPAHVAILDTIGRLLLPASSFRGALRAHAERILRTIHGEQSACYPDNGGARSACGSVYDLPGLDRLCPICKVFGAPGWRSSLRVSDFATSDPVRPDQMLLQDFLAIDRFTGGGAGGAKFNACAVYKPILYGTIAVDLQALKTVGAETWGLGLLALALRDLAEGDIRLGFGSAKGYGTVRGSITGASFPEPTQCPSNIVPDLSDDQWQRAKLGRLAWAELKSLIETGVTQLVEFKTPAAMYEDK